MPTTLYEPRVSLYEDLVIDKETRNTISDSFATYKIPSHLDMPEIEVFLVEEPAPSGPFGANGVGEPGMTNVAPAIANTLYDAKVSEYIPCR